MVDIKKLNIGDMVHYIPSHYEEINKWENGIVKGISSTGSVFVVYNCNGEWHRFLDYTAASTRPEDLYLDWKYQR